MLQGRPQQGNDAGLKLWYNKPAVAWEEALPLGNGKNRRHGLCGLITERLQLNDNTLWSGYRKPVIILMAQQYCHR